MVMRVRNAKLSVRGTQEVQGEDALRVLLARRSTGRKEFV